MHTSPWTQAVDTRSPAVVQLLALALEIRRALRFQERVRVVIPKSVYDAVPPEVFQELISDSLSHWFAHLEERVTLVVKPTSHFEIETLERED